MSNAHPKLTLEKGDQVKCRLWYAYEVPPFEGKGDPQLKLTLEIPGEEGKRAFYGSLALLPDLRSIGVLESEAPAEDGGHKVKRGRPWIILEKRDVPQGERQIFAVGVNGSAPDDASSSSSTSSRTATPAPAPAAANPRDPKAIRVEWRNLMEATLAAARIAGVAMGEARQQAGEGSTVPIDQQALASLIATILIRGEKMGVGTYPGMTKGKACLFCGEADE